MYAKAGSNADFGNNNRAQTMRLELMAKSKAQQNAMLLDPQRQMIAKQNAVLPGGPENNNPMNVTDFSAPPVQSDSIYGDYKQQYPQMGTGMLNPMAIGPSGLQQNFPSGRGKNSRRAVWNAAMQPNTSVQLLLSQTVMESNRIRLAMSM